MHQILTAVVGAAMGGIGFFARRVLRRDALTEVIERRLRLVSLHQRMKAAGLTEQDLMDLERGLNPAHLQPHGTGSGDCRRIRPDRCVRHRAPNPS